jgi:hypothetical protein
MTQVSYLRVIGRLLPDGRLRLRPGYLVDRAPWVDQEGQGDGSLVAELFAADGTGLGRHLLRTTSTCTFGDPRPTVAVRGWVPFHPDTDRLQIEYRGRTVYAQRRSPEPPRMEITDTPDGRAAGRVRIGWDATAGGEAALQFLLRWSADDGRTWHRIGRRTSEREMVIDVDELPGGERCRVAVVATDGLDTTTVTSRPFAVAPKPCRAIVIAPVDGSAVGANQPVELLGQGWWLEEARAEREVLAWTSSLDGDLGRGPALQVRLSPGEHRITLTAGADGRQGEESVTLRIVDPSVAS